MDDLRMLVFPVILLFFVLKEWQRFRPSKKPGNVMLPAPRTQLRGTAPRRFRVMSEGGTLTISAPPPKATAEVVICAFLSLLLILYLMMSRPWAYPSAYHVIRAFDVVSAAIGAVVFSYYTLAKLFNRTIIKAGRERLYVRQTPLPWFGVLDLPISEVQNLYAVYHVIRHNRRTIHGVNITYGVRAVLNDGWRREIVGKLREADDALYIQQKLEQHLAITSQIVRHYPRQ